jgi:hypothetical protein
MGAVYIMQNKNKDPNKIGKADNNSLEAWKGQDRTSLKSLGDMTSLESLKGTWHFWIAYKGQDFLEKPKRGRTSLKSLKETVHLWKAWQRQDRTSVKSLKRTELLWKAWKGQGVFGKLEWNRASLKSLKEPGTSFQNLKGTGLLWKAWNGQDFFGKHGMDRTCL